MASNIEIHHEAIRKMAVEHHGPVGKIVEHKAYQVETIAKVLLSIPGSGRIYDPGEYWLRRGPKVYHWIRTLPTHQASAPGEPPAGDSGHLAASLGHTLIIRNGRMVAQVRAKANYGIYLELGTLYMRPRPFLRPALSSAMRTK